MTPNDAALAPTRPEPALSVDPSWGDMRASVKFTVLQHPASSAKSKEGPQDAQRWRVPIARDDMTWGRGDALVTLVMFGCAGSSEAERLNLLMRRLRAAYEDHVRVVCKALPADIAEPTETGGDWPAFTHGQQLALDLGLWSTPALFVNGRRVLPVESYDDVAPVIDSELDLARDLVASGVDAANVYSTLQATARSVAADERAAPAVDRGNPTLGPADAVVIQTFVDFGSEDARAVLRTLLELRKNDPSRVRLVFRHLPGPTDERARLAAEAASEVFVQRGADAFWRYQALLFDNQRFLDRATLREFALQLGVEMTRFDTALHDGRHRAQIARDVAAANAVGAAGAPTVMIGNYFVAGRQPLVRVARLVEHAAGLSALQ